MSNELLYNKHRPLRFDQVAGNEESTDVLTGLLRHNGVKNAHFIFCGPPGNGKTTSARILARAINCIDLGDDGEPCNECKNCEAFLSESYADYIEVDGTSYNKVEDAKRLVDLASQYPINPKGQRVIMIDEAHALSNSAFDKFLLLLESGDVRTTFIFSTTDIHLFRAAIVSRCYLFTLKPLGSRAIAQELLRICKAEGVEYSPEAINKLAFQYSGKPRDSVKTLGMHIASTGSFLKYSQTTQETVLLEVFKLAYYNKVDEYLDLLERVDTENIFRGLTRMLNEVFMFPNRQPILIKADDIESFQSLIDKANLKQIVRDVMQFKPNDPYTLQLFLAQVTDLGFKLQTKEKAQSHMVGRRFIGDKKTAPKVTSSKASRGSSNVDPLDDMEAPEPTSKLEPKPKSNPNPKPSKPSPADLDDLDDFDNLSEAPPEEEAVDMNALALNGFKQRETQSDEI